MLYNKLLIRLQNLIQMEGQSVWDGIIDDR
jgi:hypothetical protein